MLIKKVSLFCFILHVYVSITCKLHINSTHSSCLDFVFRNGILDDKPVEVHILMKIQAFKNSVHRCFYEDEKNRLVEH